jgi:hypothetical protein
MPAGYGIGDHRLFIIDIHTSLLVGTGPPRLRRASSRRLNTRLPHVVTKYNKSLEENILQHRLIKKLGKGHSQSNSVEEIQSRINEIDQQSKQYMKHAENNCRKLKSGRICFSPESVIWIKREQICCLLGGIKIRLHKEQREYEKISKKATDPKPLSDLNGRT